MSQRGTVLLSLLAGIFLSFPALAQVAPDSLAGKVNTLHRGLTDSLASLAAVSRIRDSIAVSAWSDSLRSRVNRRFSPDALSQVSDSLRKINLPEPVVARHADSLLKKKAALLQEVEDKQSALDRKVTGRYTGWTENLLKKFNLDSAGISLPGANFDRQPPRVPATGLPVNHGTGLPDVPPLPALATEDFSSLGVSEELAGVGGPATIPSATQLGEWQKSIPAPAFGQSMPDLTGEPGRQMEELKERMTNPADAAEKSLTNVAEISEATSTLKQAEELSKQNEVSQAAEQVKDPVVLKEHAVDHFGGKETELQAAMGQMAKYKKKYPSMSSLSEIPKKNWLPRNGLKGKPFRERFRPGMNLGVRTNNDSVLLDLYPNAAYRFTGRLEAGLGGIYRLRLSTDPFGLDQQDPVWGLAAFVVVKTFKSVFIRLETDGTSHVRQATAEQPSYRDWRWSFHAGVQTNFKIAKRWTGNVQMLYNFESNLKDGFPERLTGRVGVQYGLLKK